MLPILARLIPFAFFEAVDNAAEFKTQNKPKDFRKNKSKEIWKAEISARKAYTEWKKAGKPSDPNNHLFQEKHDARSHLRKATHNELIITS